MPRQSLLRARLARPLTQLAQEVSQRPLKLCLARVTTPYLSPARQLYTDTSGCTGLGVKCRFSVCYSTPFRLYPNSSTAPSPLFKAGKPPHQSPGPQVIDLNNPFIYTTAS